MNRMLTAVLALVPALALAACTTQIQGGGGDDYTKAEAAALHGVDPDGNDICAAEGWYGDGVCDSFCPTGDGADCGTTSPCPAQGDPSVHYVATADHYQTCMTADFACASGQVAFDSPACGCGCIEQPPAGPTCGGLAGTACAAGTFCDFPPSASCGIADQTGTCQPIPAACPDYYGPVCGCDGKTYDNECFARGAGVSVAADGACGRASGAVCGGFPGTPCPSGQFCSFAPDAMCGAADQTGTCAPLPQACDTIYDPVCGCDGKTYGNGCNANAAGTSVATSGPCANGN